MAYTEDDGHIIWNVLYPLKILETVWGAGYRLNK